MKGGNVEDGEMNGDKMENEIKAKFERIELGDGRAVLYHGDCRKVLPTLADNSVDSIVTDPPAGIAFMGRGWDSDRGGRDKWIDWMEGIARECLRVL